MSGAKNLHKQCHVRKLLRGDGMWCGFVLVPRLGIPGRGSCCVCDTLLGPLAVRGMSVRVIGVPKAATFSQTFGSQKVKIVI